MDVDRDYSTTSRAGGYAAIDIDPGYQKLRARTRWTTCATGTRTTTSSAPPAAVVPAPGTRQQGVRRLVSIGDRKADARVPEILHGRQELPLDQADPAHGEARAVPRDGRPERAAGPLPRRLRARRGLDTRLYASDGPDPGTLRQSSAPGARRSRPPRRRRPDADASAKRAKPAAAPGLVDARAAGGRQAVLAGAKLRLPRLLPRLRLAQGYYAEAGPRTYTIRDEKGDRHRAYRLVLSTGTDGEYYGIQGMTWTDPPILDDPDETRTIAGRRLQLYRDGRAIRSSRSRRGGRSTGSPTRSRRRSPTARCSPPHSP